MDKGKGKEVVQEQLESETGTHEMGKETQTERVIKIQQHTDHHQNIGTDQECSKGNSKEK